MTTIKYSTVSKLMVVRDDENLGIDIPIPQAHQIPPGGMVNVPTGIVFEFPIFSRLRRTLYQILTGLDISGIGGIVKPRGRSQLLIGSGVIDPGYRGQLVIRVYNPTDKPVFITAGESFAQLVLMPCVHYTPVQVPANKISCKTRRGGAGGIHGG